ncbi:MAG: OsmC family protein [Rhizobiales bacterium]|nr:OsmC family protein [Hyphomicrobiales bacterium]NRB13738.1 OsmC family protein [Hyphomicrobiales bacterium]
MSVKHIQNSVKDVIAYVNDNPQEAVSTSPPFVAVMEDDLRCRVTGSNDRSIVTDMPKAVGGGGSAPSPGWLLMAALATCDCTRIKLRAAELGITLDTLEVKTDSVDDDRGLFGLDKSVPAGALSLRTRVKIGATGIEEKVLRDIVDFSVTHSPVADACRRAIPSKVEVRIA